MAKRIDVAGISSVIGTLYPPPFDKRCRACERKQLGDAAALTQFSVNLLRLPPRTWSSQRHWHTAGDEFVYVVCGEVVLVTDEGPEVLRAGDAAGFRAGEKNGHCLQNRSDVDAMVLEISARLPNDAVYYSDIDMISPADETPAIYTRRNGTPYTDIKRRGPEG